jgi:hypothetical protein
MLMLPSQKVTDPRERVGISGGLTCKTMRSTEDEQETRNYV